MKSRSIQRAERRERRRQRWTYRIAVALAILGVVVLVGGVLTWLTGEGEYTLGQSIYFSLFTVATVGYFELPHLEDHPGGREVAALIIVFGLGVIALFQSTLTALLVEGVMGQMFRRRRMQKKIAGLKGHFVIVGCGRVGSYVVAELNQVKRPFVVIDSDQHAIDHLAHELGVDFLHVIGDATDDATLEAASVKSAAGLVCALSLDRDNLFVTLSARTLNAGLRIISKVVEAHNVGKFLRAGASSTVTPQHIGGMRLANELVRPKVTAFLDGMLHLTESMRFEEIVVSDHSELVGSTLRDLRLRDTSRLLVVALHLADDSFVYNPGADARIDAGMRLIVLGESADVDRFRGRVSIA